MTGEFNLISNTPGVYGICSPLSLTNRFLLTPTISFFSYIINYFLLFPFISFFFSFTNLFYILTLTNFIIFILTTSIISINIFYIILSNISKYNSNMNNICSYSIPRRVRYTYKICY